MTVKNDLNELICKWINNRYNVEAVRAELGTTTDTYDYGGCPTCGPEYTKEFDIYYWTDNGSYHSVTVDGDPLSWLAYTLLDFEDEINRYEDSLD